MTMPSHSHVRSDTLVPHGMLRYLKGKEEPPVLYELSGLFVILIEGMAEFALHGILRP